MSTAAASPAVPPASAPEGTVRVSPTAAKIAGAVLVCAFIVTFWDFFLRQARFAYTQPSDWGHTVVIPFISGYFVWTMRAKLTARPFQPAWSGLAVLLLGVMIYMVSAFGPQTLQHHNLQGFGVGVTAFGVLAMIFGWSAMRWLWFPWAYWVVFGQTISERALSTVTERMQDWSAIGADALLNLCTIDTERVGNVLTIHLSNGKAVPLNVAEACSGMRMLVAFMALGVAMAYMGLPRWWQRALLVALGFPISLVVNVLRVASLGGLALVDANFTAGEFHEIVGLVWLVPAFLLFLGTMWVIRNMLVDEPTPAAAAARKPRPARGGDGGSA